MSDHDRQRWNRRYREADRDDGLPPAGFLVQLADRLPARGRALDVAGGAGRNAIWLAERGLEVTVADISEAGLELAARRARAAGVELTCVQVDFEGEPLPAGPWQLIVCFHYLQRDLLPVMAEALAPGGLLVWCHPTVRNLERHPRPSRRFLLDEGEGIGLVEAAGLAIESAEEGWSDEGRHELRLVARKRRDFVASRDP